MLNPLDALWGALLDDIDIDIMSQLLVISCHVTAESEEIKHRLELKALSEFRFFNSIPGQWKYAELTEIHINRTSSGNMQIEIVLWSEDAGLVAIADSVELDGEPVTM